MNEPLLDVGALARAVAADADAVAVLVEALRPHLAPDPASAPNPYLRAPEAAEYLRCSVGRVRNLTSAGRLPVLRDGRRVLYERAALDRYLGRAEPTG